MIFKTADIIPEIHPSWKEFLLVEFKKDSFKKLEIFLKEERASNDVYPSEKQVFNAFKLTPLDNVKVVILGQDPYHGKGQAHGLSFSVPFGVKIPPSLMNIFKEIQSDLKINISDHGNLEKWADQGVLLLNATLSVRAEQPGSHQGKGWEEFTDAVIAKLSEEKEHLVFLLWGKFAQEKSELIDAKKHLILTAAHPSPFSAYRGFFGCKHFSKANKYLIDNAMKAIDWELNRREGLLF